MADFVKEHKRNNRFSVNRGIQLFIKVNDDERNFFNATMELLRKRRNTGKNVETFLYLLRKYSKQLEPYKFAGREPWGSAYRDKGIRFAINEEENKLWEKCLAMFGGTKVQLLNYLVDQEFAFQDELETAN